MSSWQLPSDSWWCVAIGSHLANCHHGDCMVVAQPWQHFLRLGKAMKSPLVLQSQIAVQPALRWCKAETGDCVNCQRWHHHHCKKGWTWRHLMITGWWPVDSKLSSHCFNDQVALTKECCPTEHIFKGKQWPFEGVGVVCWCAHKKLMLKECAPP